ncbi:MAG: c-type cytochrome [Paracoccaceae bacterium]
MTQISNNLDDPKRQARGIVHSLTVLLFLAATTAQAETADAEYGQFLSGECTTCHQENGGDAGIPSIVNWPEQDFIAAMHEYKNKHRGHPIMQVIAGRLNDEEIAALAEYFANIQN